MVVKRSIDAAGPDETASDSPAPDVEAAEAVARSVADADGPSTGAPVRGKAVLIVDDSRTMRSFIRDTLAEAQLFEEFVEADNGLAALKLSLTRRFDVVLCDVEMPGLDGFGFVERFRRHPWGHMVPVVMLSGLATPEKKVEGFARGANDYLVKPCHPAELCARVRNYLRLKLLQDEVAEKNNQLLRMNVELAELATTDPLTGLHNRRHFMARSQEELKRCRRHRHHFGLLMVDVDHFKLVNDTYGHAQGDAVLVTLAGLLRRTLRETDLLSRFGGEEFVVCLPETGFEQSLFVAEKLRACIEACAIPGMGRSPTVSIGVCAYPVSTAESIEAMLELADQALYLAKDRGRNRVETVPVTTTARTT